jgi:hypothetical protein
VSAGEKLIQQNQADQAGTSSGSYGDLAITNLIPRQAEVRNFKALWDAGLRPQIRITSWLNGGTSGSTIALRAAIGYFDDGDSNSAWTLAQLVTGDLCSVTGTTDSLKISDWADVTGTAPTSQAHGIVRIQVKGTGSNGTMRATVCSLRWVSS